MSSFVRRVFVIALAAAVMPAAAAWQQTPSKAAPANPVTEAFGDLSKGRYLATIQRLRAGASEEPASIAASALAQVEPFVTGMPSRPTGGAPEPNAELLASIEGATSRPAVAEIVERARRTNIVILNEAHDNPQHRAFGLEVARALRPLGYNILALEAFANPPNSEEGVAAMAALARRGHPTGGAGFYIAEPLFADFVRQSLALGYRPVAYEHSGPDEGGSMEEQIGRREQGQAENLVRRIFARDPQARVFIYVGYGHAAEVALPGRTEWMAARLKRMTGVDPLTIDQTGLTEFSGSSTIRSYHRAAARRIGGGSGVLMSSGRPLIVGSFRDAVDIQVVHAPMRLIYGRPDWLWRMGRRPVPVPEDLRPAHSERLVQAFVRSEGDGAIPLDQVLLRPGEPVPVLMLPNVPVRFAYEEAPPPAAAAPPQQQQVQAGGS